MHQLRVIHVDDDETFLKHFRKMISKEAEIAYEQGSTDVEASVAYIKSNPPDIVFVDVEMPEKDGFWLAEKIKNLSLDIVFITSHTGYAIKAFEACAVDYLLKPVTEKKWKDFFARYKSRKDRKKTIANQQLKELISHYLTEEEKPSRIFINTAGKIDIINLDEVLYFSSKGNFTEVVMLDENKYTSGKSIKSYEEAIFKNKSFLRIHRSIIINRSYVKTILRDTRKHRFAVVMKNGDELEISFLRKDEILATLME